MILEIRKYLNFILIAHVCMYVYLSDKRILFREDLFSYGSFANSGLAGTIDYNLLYCYIRRSKQIFGKLEMSKFSEKIRV